MPEVAKTTPKSEIATLAGVVAAVVGAHARAMRASARDAQGGWGAGERCACATNPSVSVFVMCR